MMAESLESTLEDFFSLIEVENPRKRKELIISFLDEANDEQLKLAYMILSVIIR